MFGPSPGATSANMAAVVVHSPGAVTLALARFGGQDWNDESGIDVI